MSSLLQSSGWASLFSCRHGRRRLLWYLELETYSLIRMANILIGIKPLPMLSLSRCGQVMTTSSNIYSAMARGPWGRMREVSLMKRYWLGFPIGRSTLTERLMAEDLRASLVQAEQACTYITHPFSSDNN